MERYGGHMTSETLFDGEYLSSGRSGVQWGDAQSEETEPTQADFSWLVALPFIITFSDSIFSYFLRPLGFTITANAIVPLVLIVVAVFVAPSVLKISWTYILWLGVLVLSLSLAAMTAAHVSIYRILEAGGCAVAFYSGYILWRQCHEARQLNLILSSMSLLYISICTIALLKIDPVHFPITETYWSMDGVEQARPRLTADANMQFYYLFPAALALVLPARFLRTSVAIVAAIGTLYILSMLQTRSGVLVFVIVLLLALAAPVWKSDLGRGKSIALAMFGAILVVGAWPMIGKLTAALFYRFQDSTMASGNGRIDSTLYIFEHLLDPYWWIPRGPDEFLRRFGNLPHSNLTGIYLDGGLLGLIAWAMLVVRPLAKGTFLFFSHRLDSVAVMALIAGVAVAILQLTLFNTTMDQVWLWAGAVAGGLSRIETFPDDSEHIETQSNTVYE